MATRSNDYGLIIESDLNRVVVPWHRIAAVRVRRGIAVLTITGPKAQILLPAGLLPHELHTRIPAHTRNPSRAQGGAGPDGGSVHGVNEGGVVTPMNRAGSGEPELLLHGYTLSHHSWHRVVDNLSRDYDVIAMTMPGHWGGPRLRLRDVGVRGITEGIERELDKLGWETCHIAGTSLGGEIGFELERRGRARSLAAINPSGG
ncbi:alpha/beta fold hydrolase [Gordonia sp. NPDC127522]|uniref:alpha/beta fold hydrolase n=1 Tax=Gordonia sp. NPDC127522 TaxID=3345390 RepID=UPI00362599FA